MPASAPHRPTASARPVRTLSACLLILALTGGPALGAAQLDAPARDAPESGAVAGIGPLAADPGHRMGGTSPASAGPHLQGATEASAASAAGGAPCIAVSRGGSAAQHAWLERMLIGARRQTDGG